VFVLLPVSSPPSSSRCTALDQLPCSRRFFDELAVIFDQVATYQEPIYVVGDFNIWLDRPDNPHADQLRLLAECYGLVLHDTGPTHQLGGTLDAVITHELTGCPSCVTAEDVGLSDHFLLRWEVSTTSREASPTVSVCARPWRRLDIDQFRSELLMSRPTMLMTWQRCIPTNLTAYSIGFYLRGNLFNDSGYQTPGLIRSVATPNVSLFS